MKSAFDDDEEEPATTMQVPALQLNPESEPAPEPVHVPEPEPEVAPAPILDEEPQWGFDDAQIEAARRASVPVSAEEGEPAMEVIQKAAKPNRWIGLLFAAVAVIALAFAGLAGWNWWQKKNEPPPAPVVVAKPRVRKHPSVAAAATPIPAAATTTTTTTTAATTTVPGSMVIKPPAPAPVVATATVAPKPATAPPAAMKVTPSTTKLTENAAGTKTISNVGASTSTSTPKPPSSDANRGHYEEMAKTFAAQASGNYTVQFELVCEGSSLTKAIKDGGSSVWFVPTSYRGRSCYRVFWGHFTTHDEAARAAREIPMSIRGTGGVVVKVPKP
jgi:cytoskeletal protein RodZ